MSGAGLALVAAGGALFPAGRYVPSALSCRALSALRRSFRGHTSARDMPVIRNAPLLINARMPSAHFTSGWSVASTVMPSAAYTPARVRSAQPRTWDSRRTRNPHVKIWVASPRVAAVSAGSLPRLPGSYCAIHPQAKPGRNGPGGCEVVPGLCVGLTRPAVGAL